jgi:transcriptional regulator with XRE-family HTH domain
MKLDKFMADREMTDSQLAEEIRRSRSMVTRYRLGQCRPPFDVIMAIKRATEGKVGFEDFT